jgi:hypothetical protein
MARRAASLRSANSKTVPCAAIPVTCWLIPYNSVKYRFVDWELSIRMDTGQRTANLAMLLLLTSFSSANSAVNTVIGSVEVRANCGLARGEHPQLLSTKADLSHLRAQGTTSYETSALRRRPSVFTWLSVNEPRTTGAFLNLQAEIPVDSPVRPRI